MLNTMVRISLQLVCLVIVIVKCYTNGIYFQTCNDYINKKSSSKYLTSLVTSSTYTCAWECYITYQCEAYTFDSGDRTCSLYRNREVDDINETTTDTQLYIRRNPDGSTCSPHWYYYKQEDSCYFISDFQIPWLDSLAYCWEQMGAYLTNINDQNEQYFLEHLINKTINSDIWIGVRWISPSFMWMSNFNIDPQALPYTNWRAHQPGSDTGVVCLREQFTFTWDNVPETAEKRYFVCKKPAVSC